MIEIMFVPIRFSNINHSATRIYGIHIYVYSLHLSAVLKKILLKLKLNTNTNTFMIKD